jgi:diguanylate cyclase (GGDEF)-like protein
MSGLFTSIRFVMALLTVLAIAAKPFIPQKTLLIHPREDITTGIFGPTIDGAPTVSYIDDDPFTWRCDYPERLNSISCGLSLFWNPEDTPYTNTIDASQYDGLLLDITYEGRAQHLRIFLNNYNPEHEKILPGISTKYLTAFVSTEELRSGPTFVSLRNFTVEEWWIAKENPPRRISGPEFGHLVHMGTDTFDPGVHRVRINKVELVGRSIANETYLLLILMFWVGLLSFEGLLRYYRLKRAAQQQRDQLQNLSGGTDQLAKENTELYSRAITDPLTKVWNRNGLLEHLQKSDCQHLLPTGAGLMVMDIDNFKAINDTHGHAVGDVILQEFAALIRSEIRAADAFARWGGEEFVLLVKDTSAATLKGLAEKLRLRVAAHKFSLPDKQTLTMSVGIAVAESPESLDSLFKRADAALYQAKTTRNAVGCAFPV